MITHRQLQLSDYRMAISLDDQLNIKPSKAWQDLLQPVLFELGASAPGNITTEDALTLLHGILATIDPFCMNEGLIEKIEQIAVGANNQDSITDPQTLPSISTEYKGNYPAGDSTSLWVGDITRLKADAIVNAANLEMLGCRQPNHACIDNAIHSAAGPQLRDDCATIIDRQQAIERIGEAKITRGYALPSRYVLHTVGPQLRPGSQPTEHEKQQLVRVYQSCLELASQIDAIRSVAFCAVSTGIFSYPRKQAAMVALSTVASWVRENPNRFDKVIFNLYSGADASVYEELLNSRDWSCN